MDRAKWTGTDGRLKTLARVFLVILGDTHTGGDFDILGQGEGGSGKHGPGFGALVLADAAVQYTPGQSVIAETLDVEFLVEVKEAHPPVQALPGRVFQTKLLAQLALRRKAVGRLGWKRNQTQPAGRTPDRAKATVHVAARPAVQPVPTGQRDQAELTQSIVQLAGKPVARQVLRIASVLGSFVAP